MLIQSPLSIHLVSQKTLNFLNCYLQCIGVVPPAYPTVGGTDRFPWAGGGTYLGRCIIFLTFHHGFLVLVIQGLPSILIMKALPLLTRLFINLFSGDLGSGGGMLVGL